MAIAEDINKVMRDIPDFPKKGIVFKDITPVLADIVLYNRIIDEMAENWKNAGVTKIAGIESRGFIFGISLAQKLKVPFAPVRKKGKLPYKTVSASYKLEYGEATIEMHADAVDEKDNVLIVDDLLATGGTVSAVAELIKKLNAKVAGCAFVIELAFLNAKEILKDIKYTSLIKY